MTFLAKIANHIKDQYQGVQDLQRLTVILPSERAKKYLIAELYNAFGHPIIAPEITTMDRWMKANAPLPITDRTRALIRLFRIQDKTKDGRSFDEFINWGNIILSDFDEVDRYLIDAKQLFRNLRDIKELESFGDEELTESQVRFMQFWDQLGGYYEALYTNLSTENLMLSGDAYRKVSDQILEFEKSREQQYIFAGLNALSNAELQIIKKLVRGNQAEVFVDADKYYLDNLNHEAGLFIRKLSHELGGAKLNFISDRLSSKNLQVTAIDCVQNTGQAKVAGSILSQLNRTQLDETLLLLADESLIGAVIKNLPKSIERANISLGLPIRNTSVRTWVNLLFSIQENHLRFNTNAVYFKDLVTYWNHPLIIAVLNESEKKKLIEVEKELIKKNKIFVNPKNLDIDGTTQELLLRIVEPWKDWGEAIGRFRKLNQEIFSQLSKDFSFEKAALECFDRALLDFENIASEGLPKMNLKTFKQLFDLHWSSKPIAYHGNPIDGLQIMGLLETRALDFKRIICIGMNEGKLPPTNPIQTFIPMDLRKAFGMPTPRDKQGLFAHHFYRLLHSCEEMYITYCSADESFGSNEQSRYLMQLEMELARHNKNVVLKEELYTVKHEELQLSQQILKSDQIIRRMDELFVTSTSASMLNTYLRCPLDFYYRYVMGFGEAESVEQEIENNTFGTFIHDTLEELYLPFARYNKHGKEQNVKSINSVDIERMLKDYPAVLHKQFMMHFNGDKEAFSSGKNLLSYQMADELVKRFLKSEIKFVAAQSEPVTIEMLEMEFETEISVNVNGHQKKVNLRGKIDRVDKVGDKVRIIDYKSGKVSEMNVEFRKGDVEDEQIVESLSNSNRKHLLQLLQYSYLYYSKFGVVPESSIISFVSGNNEPFILSGSQLELEDLIERFPDYLGIIMGEVYETDIVFEHQVKGQFSYCKFCE